MAWRPAAIMLLRSFERQSLAVLRYLQILYAILTYFYMSARLRHAFGAGFA